MIPVDVCVPILLNVKLDMVWMSDVRTGWWGLDILQKHGS